MCVWLPQAASSLVAFCVGSKAEEGSVDLFKQTIVRLFSMLHALAAAFALGSPQRETAHYYTILYYTILYMLCYTIL